MRGRPHVLAILGVVLLITVILGISVGPVSLPLMDVLKVLLSGLPGLSGLSNSVPPAHRTIVMDIRLPVVVMALLVGAGLSSSGAAMQGLFKNPLVDPFIIGISAGGAFGWVLGLLAGERVAFVDSDIVRAFLSFSFGIGTVTAAYLLSRTGSTIPLTNLLLAGVALSASMTAATQLAVYLFIDNPTPIIFSLMGSCANSRWSEIAVVAPVVIIGVLILSFFGRELNAFSTGEDNARYLGIEVERMKVIILAVGTLVAAIGIPFCGMIGFVGLMVPHIVRRLIGPDHRYLLPASALFGGAFLVLCDLFSRTVLDVAIPLGIVTGLIGGGFFIYLLKARRAYT
ncbi:MAG: iron chelate uptake ABC transporter family permease subunit [Candidatus Thermoplasmatota archaeon]|nr:iron chelate uptake ABC transporter family permease subunit [Candidatus Thermoplasmatota archaeon]